MIDIKGVRWRSIGQLVHVIGKVPHPYRHVFKVKDLRGFTYEENKLYIVTHYTDIVIPVANWSNNDIDRVDNILTQMLVHPTQETCHRLLNVK